MDPFIVIAIVLFAAFFFFHMFRNSDSTIPEVSILEYLPNGLLYPIIQDPQNYTRTTHQLVKRFGRVFHARLGMHYQLVTAVPEDVAQVLTSQQFRRPDYVLFVFGNISTGGLFTMPQDVHRTVRQTLNKNFGSSMLKSLEPQMNAAVKELCEMLEQATGKVVDISATLAITTFRLVTNVAFGSRMEKAKREEFNRVITQYFAEIMKELVGYPIRGHLRCFGVGRGLWECKATIDKTCREFVRKRLEESKEEREKRNRDMLDIFLDLDIIDEETVASLVVDFALAGSHTSNHMISWAIYEACCNKRVLGEIEKEIERVLGDKPLDELISLEELQQMPYIHKVWRESLRLHTVIPGIHRTASSDVTLKGSGVRVPKGRTVLALFSAMQSDPGIWSEPKVFKPERWGSAGEHGKDKRVPSGAFIPYGLGSGTCPGKFLADYEGPLVLAELHRRFRFELACEPEEVVRCTHLFDAPRYASEKRGEWDMGPPMRVDIRR